jgi:hypothetical protein
MVEHSVNVCKAAFMPSTQGENQRVISLPTPMTVQAEEQRAVLAPNMVE